jgi:tetratricopeptide (TPR) repeat protein
VKALELDPRNYTVLLQAGNFRISRMLFEEAEALYRGATEVAPARAGGWTGLGNAHAQQLEHEPAIAAYRRSLGINDRDPQVLRKARRRALPPQPFQGGHRDLPAGPGARARRCPNRRGDCAGEATLAKQSRYRD